MIKLDVVETAFPLGESRAFSFTVAPESLAQGADMQQFRGEIRVDGTVMNTGSRFRGAGGISPKKCGLTIMPLGKEPSVSSRPWRSSSSSPNRGMSFNSCSTARRLANLSSPVM